ncbi:hypothetical protein DSCW_53740 [Desulfosarcina widdelii]|uniref:Lipoprotein n=1 Tax=Desulfosarcina widdelii TaxID=947919 RepID=A0A5K7ZNV8_9BACT|nr:hypothetical protein [Desulfosarcina widdelii]BBO77957.1 hypothetical protein DSCW_53740 [Desulfosarcina widdelii]
MNLSFFRYLIVFTVCICFLTTGCASSLTSSSPLHTTIAEGEKRLSGTDDIRFDVHRNLEDDFLVVTQTPVCREMTTRESVSRKQLHGVLPAIIEIGFFGLGILDLVMANAIVKNSETRAPLDDAPTGNKVACASSQPAADQQVILQYAGLDRLQYGLTDANGIIRTEAPLPEKPFRYVNVFVRTGTAKRFAGAVWMTPAPLE